jgi:pyruvate,orthophosphate dikinase
VESSLFAAYLEKGVFTISPFETIDADGVGRLVQIGAEEGAPGQARPEAAVR